eukprot:GHVS01045152.1.p1 GENE.GHVS01045152.1~~GHVS01045152.1.p1  ORF type:complete len:279 (-),score=36.97 GHVS01045152.1:228-1064(-)
MELYWLCTAVLVLLSSTGVHGAGMLRDRRGLQIWQASMDGRSCKELGDLCKMSLTDAMCVVSSSVCYEMLHCEPEAKCTVEWSRVLQTYDRELFTEVQAIMWSFFSMSPDGQKDFVSNITSSITTGEGGASIMERSLKLFDSLAKVLPIVQADLLIQFNSTAWDAIVKRIEQSPEELLKKIEIPQIGGDSDVTKEGNGLMSQLASVFVLPDGFSFGQFMSTIKWDKGLLENLGLDYGSFTQIVQSLSDEEGRLEDLASDLGLLVKNVHGLRKIATSVA